MSAIVCEALWHGPVRHDDGGWSLSAVLDGQVAHRHLEQAPAAVPRVALELPSHLQTQSMGPLYVSCTRKVWARWSRLEGQSGRVHARATVQTDLVLYKQSRLTVKALGFILNRAGATPNISVGQIKH